jgi:hypothetical protein
MLEQAMRWVEMSYARMCLGRLPPEERVADDKMVDFIRLRNRLMQISGNRPETAGRMATTLPVDLAGWRHEADIPANWATYNLALWLDLTTADAAWHPRQHLLILSVEGRLRPGSVADFRGHLEDLRSSLSHELTHLAQSLLRAMRVLREPAGLPSRRRRRPKKIYDPAGLPLGWKGLPPGEAESWMEEHALREVEFQPLLGEEIEAFRRISARLEPRLRRDLLRAWVLPPERTAEPVAGRDFFWQLYRADRAKWRDAVSELAHGVRDLL